jgi:hypothetical protein
MSLPVVDSPSKHELELYRGDTFGPRNMRWRSSRGGPGVQLYGDPNITAKAEIRSPGADGALVASFVVDIVDPEIVSPTAISADFLASGVVVAAGANFITRGVLVNDRVIISGSTSNDTTEALVSSVDSEDQISVGGIFSAETAAGTVSIAADGKFSLGMASDVTSGLSSDSKATWDLEFSDVTNLPATVRTPLRGPIVVRLDSTRA